MISCSQQEVIRSIVEKDTHASFDGGIEDSGVLEVSGGVALVTARFVDRYNAMVGVYGNEPEFLPPLKEGDGITPASETQTLKHSNRGVLFLISKDALVKFIKMNQWRKMGRIPASQKTKPGIISRVIDAAIS